MCGDARPDRWRRGGRACPNAQTTNQEGLRLQQIVRRGSTSSVRYRRAMMLLASGAGAPSKPQLARTWQTYAVTALDVDQDLSQGMSERVREGGQFLVGQPSLIRIHDLDPEPAKPIGQSYTSSLSDVSAILHRAGCWAAEEHLTPADDTQARIFLREVWATAGDACQPAPEVSG